MKIDIFTKYFFTTFFDNVDIFLKLKFHTENYFSASIRTDT
jgi:hypothetical protein